MRLLLCAWLLLAAAAAPAEAQFFRIDLGSGTNLVSLPRSTYATPGYTAASLVRDSGALFVLVPGEPGTPYQLFLSGFGTPDFQLPAGRSLLLAVASKRKSTLRVPRDPTPGLPDARLQLRPGSNAVGLPLLPSVAGSPTSSALATVSNVLTIMRTRIRPEDGAAEFETQLLGSGPGFALEPGRGYLVSVARGTVPTTVATTLTLYRDTDADSIPDAVREAGLTGGATADADSDGLANLDELRIGTDPRRADTDTDSVPDGFELLRGSDPFDSTSRPPVPRVDSVNPSSAGNDASRSLTVTGFAFTDARSVVLSDLASTSLLSLLVTSDSLLTATLPAGVAPGTYELRVLSPAGVSALGGAKLVITAPIPTPTFAKDVYPIFGRRCTSCHLAGGRGTGVWAASTAQQSFDQISSRGVADPGEPVSSLLLRKPLALNAGGAGMDGGTVIFQSTSDPDYQTLLKWITAGALNN